MSNKTDQLKSAKLNIVQKLVTNLSNRKSKFDESCVDITWDEKHRRKILKIVKTMDVEIDQTISETRKIFSPVLDDYKDSEICLLLHIFASAFTMSVSRTVDSKDLDKIVRRNPDSIIQIFQSLNSAGGNLYQHISKVEMKRGAGWELEIRSSDLLYDFLMDDKSVK